ncbi:MAG TPA: HAMP domain-containing histidine kinase [Candidatus Melainabacteria bacterium]|nr:HAMP domain-containing histidine kinase [Candidatus Melainabacteria bacterium]
MNIVLSLRQKGLLVVASMLGFELILLGALSWLLNDAEKQIARHQKAQNVIASLQHLSSLREKANSGLLMQQFLKDSPDSFRFRNTFQKHLDELPIQLEKIKQLLKDDKTSLMKAAELERVTKLGISLIEQQRQFYMANNTFEERMTTARLSGVMFQTSRWTESLLEDYEKIEREISPLEKESRKRLAQALWVMVIVNIVIAIAVGQMFVRGITGRLSIITENSNNLAAGSKLNEPMKGFDEIVQLDHVFHRMADKLAESARVKQEFVQMISHDLRTPLTAIMGTFELLSSGAYGHLSERGQSRVMDAERESQRLIAMINELLDIERLESGNLQLLREDFELRPILLSATEAVSTIATPRQIKFETTSSNPTVNIDRDRIFQILINLLGNAVKYSPENGLIKLNAIDQNDFVRVEVIDQGPGIPKADQKLIFERFKQIEGEEYKRSGSSGLGLAICVALVENHGGKIGVDSEVGQGSCFWFTIPKSETKDHSAIG